MGELFNSRRKKRGGKYNENQSERGRGVGQKEGKFPMMMMMIEKNEF